MCVCVCVLIYADCVIFSELILYFNSFHVDFVLFYWRFSYFNRGFHLIFTAVLKHRFSYFFVSGTHRDTDGQLLPTAGRVGQIDEYISSASDIDSAFVDSFTAFIKTLDSTHAEASELYLSTAAKIYKKGSTYAETEIKRLSGMINSKSVSPSSKTSFQLRQNILKAFLKSESNDIDESA